MIDPVESIAIIGLDAKLPCDGDTPESFYKFIVDGRSARAPIPKERYNSDAFWHPDGHRDGVIAGDHAHLINANVKAFDAPFFSITPAEAASMDPQQRLLLECVYTAFENSGVTMNSVQGTSTGVYLGAFIFDYHDLAMKDVDAPMMYTGSGNLSCTMAGRISWFYDLKGPAISIDTACSSSMVALHQAVVGLKAGDCDMAIACGSNLILSPEMGLKLNALGVLNSESTSFSFDDRANGYGRGEGVGAVVLKRMSDALRDGDTIRAVIRNTGCNQDGHSPGLTAPLMESQLALMRKTYAQANVDPSETLFFDAHSTGTAVGDPIEGGAIASMFNQYRSPESPLVVGALKSNVGHAEGASGISSIIRAVMVLERGIIPANTWFKNKNPKILDDWHFHLPLKAMVFPKADNVDVRRMSINSFGVSGTNAHVIMEDADHFLRYRGFTAPHWTVTDPDVTKDPIAAHPVLSDEAIKRSNLSPQLHVFSSQDQEGVARLFNSYEKYLNTNKTLNTLHDLSYTIAEKRSNFRWRTAVVADSHESLTDALSQKPVVSMADPKKTGLAFIFTGQGAQWARMGAELMHYPIFTKSVQEADAYLKALGSEWSGQEELSKSAGESRVNEAEFSQPLCTIVQVALVDLLSYWGVFPKAMAGHSSGEIAAAYSAGAISRESAWKLAYWRGKLAAQLIKAPGGTKTTMVAVGLDDKAAAQAITEINNLPGFTSSRKLAIACANSRESHTISGDVPQVEALITKLKADHIFARKLAVEIGYHSSYMEPIAEEYIQRMGELLPGQQQKKNSPPIFFSSTHGRVVEAAELRDPHYWTKNLVSTVRFHEAVSLMLQHTEKTLSKDVDAADVYSIHQLLEIGPHSALQGPLRKIIEEIRPSKDGVQYRSVLKRGESGLTSAMEAAGSLHSIGYPVKVTKVNELEDVKPNMLIDLPRYAFNHSREYWYESRLSRNFRNRQYPRHELLGAPVNDWDGKHDAIWRNWIRLSENPWVEHHTVSGTVLYPAAGFLVMVIEGCKQLSERANNGKNLSGFRFKEVSFHSALRVPDNTMGVESHLYLRPVKQSAIESQASLWLEFQVCTAQEDDEFREHCRGQVLIEYEESSALDQGLENRILEENAKQNIADAKANCKTKVAAKDVYQAWEKVGLAFGPTFQTVSDPLVNHETGTAVAEVNSTIPLLKTLMPKNYIQPHLIHPTTLDGALQVCLTSLISDPSRQQKNAIVLTFVDELWVSATQPSSDVDGSQSGYTVLANTSNLSRKQFKMECTAVDQKTQKPRVLVYGLVVTEVDDEADDSPAEGEANHRSWGISWKADPTFLGPEEVGTVVGSSEESLHKYVDILAHKNPSMKILELNTNDSAPLVKAFNSRYLQYDSTAVSIPAMKSIAKDAPEGSNVNFKPLDLSLDATEQGFEPESYDLIITHENTGSFDLSNPQDKEAVKNFLQLLAPSGRLLLCPSNRTGQEIEDWTTFLTQSGFSGLEAQFHADSQFWIVSSKSNGQSTVASPSGIARQYYIIYDQASQIQHQTALQISQSLSLRGAVEVCSFSEYAALAASGQDITNNSCILLAEMTSNLLATLKKDELAAIQAMINGSRLLWVHRDDTAEADLVTGFAACVRLEKPDLNFVLLATGDNVGSDALVSSVLEVDRVVADTKTWGETSYKIIENGVLAVPRLTEDTSVTQHVKNQTVSRSKTYEAPFGADTDRALSLRCRDIGLLDSICFDDDPLYVKPLAANEVEFKTMATAVNFKDLAVMLGKINETPVGLEAAGIVTRVGSGVTRFKQGDHVFGFAFKGAYSTYTRALEGTIATIPEGMSFSDAAVLPIVYTTAYACLYDIGGLDVRAKRRDGTKPTVLIHAAAGGVGQAAIQFCQREGAEIFATVGSLEKRDFLESTYGIPRDHILSSRDQSFKTGLLRMTKGRGVDIVLNSLAGDMLRASWDCVAPFGAFAEIGLSDIESRTRISMKTFEKSARFQSLELNYMQLNDMPRLDDLFQRTFESVLYGKNKLVLATPVTAYPISEIQTALRFMQSGKHIGKLVIEPHQKDIVALTEPRFEGAKFSSDATYVVSGGFGGLGRDIIRWMADNGAKNIVVTSRRGPVGEESQKLVRDLQQRGVEIIAPPCDITDEESLLSTMSDVLSKLPSVRGCIQASTILNDNAFDKMSLEEWHSALSVKVLGTQNLWKTLTSDKFSNKLDFFVMLSSMASIIGNPGQTNYSAGNSFQDAFAREQSALGHNVVALNVPMMNDAGMVATKPHLLEYLYSIGWSHMSSKELISAIDFYCRPKTPAQTTAQLVPRLWLPCYSAAVGANQPEWQNEPRFNHMIIHGYNSNSNASSGNGSQKGVSAMLAGVATFEEAEEYLLQVVMEKLSGVLNIPVAELDAARPMSSYGVDSLVAVELRTWMTKEIGSDISVFELTGGQRISQIAAHVTKTSRFLPSGIIEKA